MRSRLTALGWPKGKVPWVLMEPLAQAAQEFLTHPGRAIGSSMVDSTASALPPYEIDALVVSAFLAARRSGRTDWRRMKIAVFKNRLLQLSKGKFDESNHGVRTFREMLESLHHKVSIEGDEVVLKEAPGTDSGQAPSPTQLPAPVDQDPSGTGPSVSNKERIRRDLWQAAVDYSSDTTYAWDPETLRARPRREGDLLVLPTVSPGEYQAWRTEFGAEHGAEKLARWTSGRGSMKELPMSLRGAWSSFLRSNVQQRLTTWFANNNLQAPEIVEVVPVPSPSTTNEDALREFVLSCVKLMTVEELERLPIPALASLRVRAREK